MTLSEFIRRVSSLAPGASMRLPMTQCETLFEPGLDTAEGRRHMYAAAAVAECSVHWHDGETIEFKKR